MARPRRSRRRAAASSNGGTDDNSAPQERNDGANDESRGRGGAEAEPAVRPPGGGRSVASHVRQWQRAVAEREASRLARPEQRKVRSLAHADVKKSAVTSTPFGRVHHRREDGGGENDDDNDDEDGTYEWCGPWSVARRMIEQREAAKRKREAELERQEEHHPLDEAMEQVQLEQKKRAHPSMTWKSSFQPSDSASSNMYAKRQKRAELYRQQGNSDAKGSRIPSLFRLCVDFVVANFEHVESLGYGVDNDIRVAISKELVARNQLNAKAFGALIEPSSMETLEIIDCSGIHQEVMAKALSDFVDLRYLLLTHAGRCFGTQSVQALLKKAKSNQSETSPPASSPFFPPSEAVSRADDVKGLRCLSIAGAYLLQDSDAASLIQAYAKTLQSLTFSTCPLLGKQLATSVGIYTKENLRELSLSDMALSGDILRAILVVTVTKSAAAAASASSDIHVDASRFANLQSLTLKSIAGLDDEILIEFLRASQPAAGGSSPLETLDVSDNYGLTDECLSGIRQYCSGRLRSLSMSGIKDITSSGLETFFMPGLEGLPPPPNLKVLNLSCCDHQAVTDGVLELVVMAAGGTSRGTPAVEDRKLPAVNSDKKASDDDNKNNSFIATRSQRMAFGGLAHLDIQGSTLVTDVAMELLAQTCSNTLTDLNVSYCPLVTDQGLGYLISKTGQQLSKVQVWGCAQFTDALFDGHDRIDDCTLEITGAWMKKSGARSLR